MDQPVDASRMTQRYARKREAILDAAARLFNARGVKGVTLSDVAAEVGLSTNSITYYYRKKEDLVVASLLRSIDTVNGIIASALEAAGAEARVRAFTALFLERLARTRLGQAGEVMGFRDVHVLGDPHAEVVFAAYVELFRRCRRLLGSAQGAGRVPLNARTHLLLTLALGAMSWSTRYAPEDAGRMAGRMSDILIHGIGSSRSAWNIPAPPALPGVPPDSPQDAFLRAATALINEQGYRGASVERISARLNVTKGAFYHHLSGKEELISACFERKFTAVRQLQAIALAGPGSGWDKLCALACALVRYHFSPQGPLLRTSAWSELPDALRDAKLITAAQLDQRFVSLLVDGMQDGSIRPLDQALAGALVADMVNAAVLLDRWVLDINADNAIELFVQPLFTGLLPAAGLPKFSQDGY
ncbi:TetR/AcrR family transcriptional regulator [Massilia sp. LXY-6]|uniref:TetR/AcrR family transcriptional regulator n=1 Tax=Massilia sp. LXY-6 TaxID=3379823 RepID=UPI003EE38144